MEKENKALRRAVREIIALRREVRALRKLAYSDTLTGLLNRRAFDNALDREVRRALRRGEGWIITLMIDANNFKGINDTHGHDAGDRALCIIADTLRGISRNVDVVARLGGDEFGVILIDTTPSSALDIAERYIRHLHTARREHEMFQYLALSIGISVHDVTDGHITVSDVMHTADAAMYGAKALKHTRPRGDSAVELRHCRTGKENS